MSARTIRAISSTRARIAGYGVSVAAVGQFTTSSPIWAAQKRCRQVTPASVFAGGQSCGSKAVLASVLLPRDARFFAALVGTGLRSRCSSITASRSASASTAVVASARACGVARLINGAFGSAGRGRLDAATVGLETSVEACGRLSNGDPGSSATIVATPSTSLKPSVSPAGRAFLAFEASPAATPPSTAALLATRDSADTDNVWPGLGDELRNAPTTPNTANATAAMPIAMIISLRRRIGASDCSDDASDSRVIRLEASKASSSANKLGGLDRGS